MTASVLTVLQARDPTSGRAVTSYAAISIGASIAILYGVRRHRPLVTTPWYLTAAAAVLGCLGMVSRLRLTGPQGTVTSLVPDLVTIPAYGLLIAGLIGLLRARRGAEAGTALDAGLMGVAALFMSWAMLIQPLLADADMPTSAKVVNGTYPTISAAILFVVALLAMTDVWSLRAFWMMGLAWVALMTGDLIYALASAGSPFLPLPVANSAYCTFGLLGAAGMHPSMASLCRPAVQHVRGYGRGRFVAVAVALLVPAVVVAVRPPSTGAERVVNAGLMCVLGVLVLLRTAGAVNRHVTAKVRLELLESAPNGMLLVDAGGRSWR
ncbi:MAG: hypothetical protein ACM3ZF_00285 [Mycobacterium leprae]